LTALTIAGTLPEPGHNNLLDMAEPTKGSPGDTVAVPRHRTRLQSACWVKHT
jgi:hypothetical protein